MLVIVCLTSSDGAQTGVYESMQQSRPKAAISSDVLRLSTLCTCDNSPSGIPPEPAGTGQFNS